jgi:Cys-tRNA(Pro)/Cys-tRNA(Cys) deacylase
MSAKTDATPVTQALDRLGIPYRFFRHAQPVSSLAQAARERGQRPEQIIRSILFRLAEDDYVMVLVAGAQQVDWPTLRRYLGITRMTMASEDEVLAVTGYPLGAVSPFGLSHPLRILADESIFVEGEVSIGSGVRYSTVILSQKDLRRALGNVERGNYVNKE